jgi:hypothetical protein
VKEVKAQSEMADLAVQLTKAKVAAGVKSSYLELNRSRQLYQLTRRMVSAGRVVDASYHSNDPEVESAQAKMEAGHVSGRARISSGIRSIRYAIVIRKGARNDSI